MRVLLIDNDAGNGQLAFVMAAQDCGHEVRWFFRRPVDWNAQPIGKGIATDIVHDWRPHADWADLIVLGDNTYHLEAVEHWRKRGKPVIGATVASAQWELDRLLGQNVFKKAGIPIPPCREFSDYDEAMRYVEKEGRAFVSKPCGAEENKALSYVADSAADLTYMLRRWKKAQKLKDHFILQEKVSGTEMAVGVFVGPDGFVGPWCENFEFKKLMSGDCGPNTGEMGTVLRFTDKSKLAAKVLAPLEDRIVATGHTGYVDVNCIIDKDGAPWPLEFTMRFGYPTWPIQQKLYDGDAAEWLFDLAGGAARGPWSKATAVGVVMAMGDFPHSHITKKEVVGVPIYNTSPQVLERVSFCEVMTGPAPIASPSGKIVEAPRYLTAGDYVLVATGLAATVEGARERAYRVLNRLKLPSSPFWRDDIGQRLRYALPGLQDHGFASGWRYGEA